MPAHLGGDLLRTFLNRGSGAGIAQRQRLGALGWSGQNEQCANRGKPENSRHVHLIFLLVCHRISRRRRAVDLVSRLAATQIAKLKVRDVNAK
jgi:hypothetical protein